ncbi:cytochrome c oxidase subunit 3 [Pelagicoccus sp. NFK12]|uniref:Cytochrome c oxidase subunit 3 n=1 Tax=Pelagicoccus enzymogenes TaxID=2773457 RepID=A0A927F7S7_9BACT|nr:cytochrome c oxidase subunit 3 [Pelagicoccus enzymogenes]MBD5779842.1 cytochrome c oxidase subunit 3 [Pelagicoccus enzymogenes]MDQ8201127.1 cytochrome c oxidase subunit 3 [Pelagicoccus enzymogenes]
MGHKIIATGRSRTGIPTGRLAVWWVVGSEIVIFGGLIAAYLLNRFLHGSWEVSAAYTNTFIGGANTFWLLTSSYFVVLAHAAAEKRDAKTARKYIWYTIGLGGLFMGFKSYEYATEISHGFTLFTSNFWSFYYTATGLHGFHVLCGMVIMAIIAEKDIKHEQNWHRVENIGIYWHFVDIVWIFLFPLLYIAK